MAQQQNVMEVDGGINGEKVLRADDPEDLQKISKCFEKDPKLSSDWGNLYYALGLSTIEKEGLSIQVNMGLLKLPDLYKKIIFSWISLHDADSTATVNQLVKILRQEKFNRVADLVMDAYGLPKLM